MIPVRQPNGQELICQGKGIGWHKRSGDEEDELYTELKAKHPHVHRCVERIADYILIHFHYDISSEEKLYLLIHISRVIKAAKRSGK